MVGLDHHGAEGETDHDDVRNAGRNARYGLVLFCFYLVLYAAFVLASAFRPEWMAERPWAGVNLAIWYGFGLIGFALALALAYSWLCRGRVES